MLTLNADGHPVMRCFQAPNDEMRMVVIFEETDYGRWLDCPLDRMAEFLPRSPAQLTTEVAPLPPCKRGSQEGAGEGGGSGPEGG